MTLSDFPKLWTATALYTVQGWSNEGPVRFSEPMPLQRALSIASQLNDQGYVHISLTDKDSGAQAPWHTFDFWNADFRPELLRGPHAQASLMLRQRDCHKTALQATCPSAHSSGGRVR